MEREWRVRIGNVGYVLIEPGGPVPEENYTPYYTSCNCEQCRSVESVSPEELVKRVRVQASAMLRYAVEDLFPWLDLTGGWTVMTPPSEATVAAFNEVRLAKEQRRTILRSGMRDAYTWIICTDSRMYVMDGGAAIATAKTAGKGYALDGLKYCIPFTVVCSAIDIDPAWVRRVIHKGLSLWGLTPEIVLDMSQEFSEVEPSPEVEEEDDTIEAEVESYCEDEEEGYEAGVREAELGEPPGFGSDFPFEWIDRVQGEGEAEQAGGDCGGPRDVGDVRPAPDCRGTGEPLTRDRLDAHKRLVARLRGRKTR